MSEPLRQSELPPRVGDATDALADRLADVAGVFLGLDYDGTLAPIVDDPDAAMMDPDVRALVTDLAVRENLRIAIVSGRGLADLRDRVGLDGVVYAGNHGLELDRGGGREVHPDADAARAAVEAVVDRVRDAVGDVPGVVVEDKGVTATVHYRQVDETEVPAVRDAVERAVAAVDADLAVTDGKEIREIRPAVPWDKGRVVEHLLDDLPDDWLAMYLGDDVTDEDAFEVVEPDGVGIHVGRDASTAASRRVDDLDGVVDVLGQVADSVGDETDRGPANDEAA